MWSELVDGDVTATADTSFKKEGSASLKLVVAAGAGAGDILATEDLTSVDLTDRTELEIWIFSTTALDAGDLQVLLDNTALCASPVETLNIPATTANTWTKHVISLANPYNDSAIISVGIKMVTDKGAFTLFVDDIKAVKASTRQYRELNPGLWDIAKGSTDYLRLTNSGLSVVGNPTQLRLTGLQLPSLLSADGTASEIDPEWIIAYVTGQLLSNHSKSSRLDIDDRLKKSDRWLGRAEVRMSSIRTGTPADTRWI